MDSLIDQFFRVFPFFASDYFYIIVIAIGYFRSSQKRLFFDLAFLVPLSSLINSTLKSIFDIERPSVETHLIPVYDMLGFPSADVQTATIFWGLLAINYKSKKLPIFSVTMIMLMGITRVYLGVHSVIDVIGGIGFGILGIIIWQKSVVISKVDEWLKGRTQNYWIVVITAMIICLSVSEKIPPMVPVSFGALIGLGIFLSNIKSLVASGRSKWASIILSLIILLVFVKLIPIIHYNSFTFWETTIAKYALVVFSIFAIFPRFQKYIDSKYFSHR